MYDISNEYKKYLSKFYTRVSLKDNIKFYGILINKEGIETFINTYYEDETIKNEEVPYLKECAIKWLDYTIKTNNFDRYHVCFQSLMIRL